MFAVKKTYTIESVYETFYQKKVVISPAHSAVWLVRSHKQWPINIEGCVVDR